MTAKRPDFRKKELALSATPYIYVPIDIPVYTVEVSHREEIDGELLQRALDRTLQRMPYLTDSIRMDSGRKTDIEKTAKICYSVSIDKENKGGCTNGGRKRPRIQRIRQLPFSSGN